MNKPDWHNKWIKLDRGGSILYWSPPKQRVLNPDIAEFVNELNERLTNVASK